MLAEFFLRAHARFFSLPILGAHLDEFVVWLHSRGFPRVPLCAQVRAAPRLDGLLRDRGVGSVGELAMDELLSFAPRDSQDDIALAAFVRSAARFFDSKGLLRLSVPGPGEVLVASYRAYLMRVRGLAESTVIHHGVTASEFLDFLGVDRDSGALKALCATRIEAFLRAVGPRLSRETLQHTVAHLRSLLRFLAARGDVDRGLEAFIDTPRVYRRDRLPRSLPWETVQAFLSAIERTTPMGRRDYAMFLLIATYGLRTSEIAALRLDDFEWRDGRIRVGRPKTSSQLVLPLTDEVGAAVIEYLRGGRPDLPHREVFLRVRAPEGPLLPTAVTEAFQGWTRRSALPIPYQGPHCLRHSLAVHLLRQGTSLKAIGDLLGHRSAESTCVYLRLHVADLRDAALDLPKEARS